MCANNILRQLETIEWYRIWIDWFSLHSVSLYSIVAYHIQYIEHITYIYLIVLRTSIRLTIIIIPTWLHIIKVALNNIVLYDDNRSSYCYVYLINLVMYYYLLKWTRRDPQHKIRVPKPRVCISITASWSVVCIYIYTYTRASTRVVRAKMCNYTLIFTGDTTKPHNERGEGARKSRGREPDKFSAAPGYIVRGFNLYNIIHIIPSYVYKPTLPSPVITYIINVYI